MSKVLAGEPLREFLKRPDSYRGCWVLVDAESAAGFQEKVRDRVKEAGRGAIINRAPVMLVGELVWMVVAELYGRQKKAPPGV